MRCRRKFLLWSGLREGPDMRPNYVFEASLVKVIDGDTYEVMVDCGFSTFRSIRVRLADVECAEAGTPSGIDATGFVKSYFGKHPKFFVRTRKTRSGDDRRSFVRYVADIYSESGISLADEIVRTGHGYRVRGPNKTPKNR